MLLLHNIFNVIIGKILENARQKTGCVHNFEKKQIKNAAAGRIMSCTAEVNFHAGFGQTESVFSRISPGCGKEIYGYRQNLIIL